MISDITFGGLLLGFCAWCSNIWPGIETWPRAALSRFVWWALPFACIALEQDVPWDHAFYLGLAAWVGAWIPHTDMPDVRDDWRALLGDVAVAVLRAASLLAIPTAVFWYCGAFWFAMAYAIGSVVPAILLADKLPHGMRGMRTERQVAGVLFGAMVGMCVAAAIAIDVPTVDYLN